MTGASFRDPEPTGPLSADEVRIWRSHVAGSQGIEACLADLDDEERERASHFRREADRARFARSHAALRRLLGAELGCKPSELGFAAGERGKPFLADNAGLQFNLSHSGDYALCALTLERDVGVDVERERPKESSPEIARRFFSEAEVRDLEALPPEEQQAAFFRTWASKEAFIKATGRGLAQPLSSFDVSLTGPARLVSVRSGNAGDWDLRALDVATGYAGAVVCAGKGWRLVTCTLTV
jgi:4'-phosphopantetheinyl transferase